MDFKRHIVENLNKAQRGAIGEYLFSHSVPNVLPIRKNGHDFDLMDGTPVDVKLTISRVKVDRPNNLVLEKSPAKRYPGIKYANVILYNDCVSVHYDDAMICVYMWDEFQSFVEKLPKWNDEWSLAKKQGNVNLSYTTGKSKGVSSRRRDTLETRLAQMDFLTEKGVGSPDAYRAMKRKEREVILNQMNVMLKSRFGWKASLTSLDWSIRVMLNITSTIRLSARNVAERVVAHDRGHVRTKDFETSLIASVVNGMQTSPKHRDLFIALAKERGLIVTIKKG